jgi:hypothetical protein
MAQEQARAGAISRGVIAKAINVATVNLVTNLIRSPSRDST